MALNYIKEGTTIVAKDILVTPLKMRKIYTVIQIVITCLLAKLA